MGTEFNLDFNASQGLDPRLRGHLSELGLGLNASSIHTAGQRARAHIERARDQLSALLNLAKPNRVVFTSGATEANNSVLNGAYWAAIKDGRTFSLVTSAIEHPSVIEPAKRLQEFGSEVIFVLPRDGRFDLEDLLQRVESLKPSLVSLMFANNETGELFDLPSISRAIRVASPKTKIHCDGVQGPGKCFVDFQRLGVDYLTLSGHKFGSLCGVGAIVIRDDHDMQPYLLGGVQESRYRAGTENILGIATLGYAAELVQAELSARIESMLEAREYFERRLLSEFPCASIVGAAAARLPNTISITIPGIVADDLVVAADLNQLLISSGAACSSGKPEPSHVLLAYGLTPEAARQTVRISLPPFLLCSERELACKVLCSAIRDTLHAELYAH